MPPNGSKTRRAPCPECMGAMDDKDLRAVFCCEEHKRAYHNRDLAGGALIILAKAWRQGRHKKGGDPTAKFAFAEFCNALDRLNAEDKAAGRQPALETLRARYRRQRIVEPVT